MLDLSTNEQLTFQQQQQQQQYMGVSGDPKQVGQQVKHDGSTQPRLIIDNSFANLHNNQQ